MMVPSGSNAFFFDVYHDGVFHLNPLRYDNDLVYNGKLYKNKKMDYKNDEDVPLVNLVESPILKRKLLGRNSLSPVAKRNLLGTKNLSPIAKRKLLVKHNNPTTYVVNKGRSVLNEASDKGKSTLHKDANTFKKVIDKGKSKMVERDCPVNLSVCRNKGIVIEDNVNPSVMESDTDSETDLAQGINYNLCSDSASEYSDKSVYYLLEFEDELIELRKRKSKAKKAPKVRKQQTQPTKEDKIKNLALGKQSKFKRYPSEIDRLNCRWRCYGKKMTAEDSVQCRNAKRWALNEWATTIEDHYGYIRSYAKAILDYNPGSIVKGLVEAVKEVMTHAKHRQCARHIYKGFRKQYSGVEFKNLFWDASKATYPKMFNKIIEKIKRVNPKAYEYLLKNEPKTWSRAYFPIGASREAVENGFSTLF
nr:pentatricopeptide repeat-containing protein [Tanacetum cinerariifolium]GEW80840.1 pentatricopeptide repeat-containing protein [Tanacetum cinerariifolium]